MSKKRIKKLKDQRRILRERIERMRVSIDYVKNTHQEEISQAKFNIKHYQKEVRKFKEEAEKTVEERVRYRRILGDCLWWACNGLHPSHMKNADLYNGLHGNYVSLQQILRICREFAVGDTKADSLLKYDDLLVSLSIHEEVEREVKLEETTA